MAVLYVVGFIFHENLSLSVLRYGINLLCAYIDNLSDQILYVLKCI
jgi:hypothetical protein